MKKIFALVLTAITVIALALLPTLASVESDMQAAVGSENSNAQFNVNINAPKEYNAGERITVTVTVDDITNGNGLTSVEFELKYDTATLSLVNQSDGDGVLDCIKKQPQGAWENLCSSVPDQGLIVCGALTFGYAESAAVNNGDLTFSFDFDIKSDASGDIGLYISHSTVYGSFNSADDVLETNGNGGYAVISAKVIVESSLPESSLPESSAAQSSSSASTESSTVSVESSLPESSTEVSGESSAVSDVSGEASDISGESSVVTNVSTPELHTSQNEGNGESSSTRFPSVIGAVSSVIGNGAESSSAPDVSQSSGGLPAFAVPIMIIGGIVLVILVAVIVLSVIDKKNNRDAINSVRHELDVD